MAKARHPSVSKRVPSRGIGALVCLTRQINSIELAIESYLPHFDEILLIAPAPFASKLDDCRGSEKISVFETLNPLESSNSMAEACNLAISSMTSKVLTRLHSAEIPIPSNMHALTDRIRRAKYQLGANLLCYSGVNLVSKGDTLKVHADEPFHGSRCHYFFDTEILPHFKAIKSEVRLSNANVHHEYGDVAYWNLQYIGESEAPTQTLEQLGQRQRHLAGRNRIFRRILCKFNRSQAIARERAGRFSTESLQRELSHLAGKSLEPALRSTIVD